MYSRNTSFLWSHRESSLLAVSRLILLSPDWGPPKTFSPLQWWLHLKAQKFNTDLISSRPGHQNYLATVGKHISHERTHISSESPAACPLILREPPMHVLPKSKEHLSRMELRQPHRLAGKQLPSVAPSPREERNEQESFASPAHPSSSCHGSQLLLCNWPLERFFFPRWNRNGRDWFCFNLTSFPSYVTFLASSLQSLG